MRVWDIPPLFLCRQHLLGEHREVHALWSIMEKGHGGYSNHPETKRWYEARGALYLRHQAVVAEMRRRGYDHESPICIDGVGNPGEVVQSTLVDSLRSQVEMLCGRCSACKDRLEGLVVT